MRMRLTSREKEIKNEDGVLTALSLWFTEPHFPLTSFI